MNDTIEIVLVPFPEDGGQLVIVSTALARELRVTSEQLATELRGASEGMLASAKATLVMDQRTRAIRFRTGNVELMLLTALVPFETKPYGILCAVLPSEQLAGERAIAQLVVKIRKQLEAVS